jgi:hypothetical protein
MKAHHVLDFVTRDGEQHRVVVETMDRVDGTLGARMTESLLMTQDLNDFRVKLWNQAIDLLESMMIVQVCNGLDITSPAYVEGVRVYVESVRNRLGL